MEKNRKAYTEKLKSFLKKNGSLCAAGVCALMVGIVFVLSTANNTGPEPTTPTSVSVQEIAVRQTGTTTTAAETTTSAVSITTTPQTQKETKQEEMLWPVKGLIQTEFAQDKLIYRTTLGEWSVHPALDIQAALGETVSAVMKGRVESVQENRLLGHMVTILHEDGWRSRYASLDTVAVTAGDTLQAGDPLGTVGSSALEEVDQGPHLHFVLEKNETPVNPMDHLTIR